MATNKAHKLITDTSMSPELAAEVQDLRGSMVGAANGADLPSSFTSEAMADRPAFLITDTATGKIAIVPIFAYHAAREMLSSLFGE